MFFVAVMAGTLILLVGIAETGRAAEWKCIATGPSVAIENGDTLVLAERVFDSNRVRLMGVEVIATSPSRHTGKVAAVAEEAERDLLALSAKSGLCLETSTESLDRYGRVVAQVFNSKGQWLQGELLGQGLARVRTTADGRLRAAEMLQIEQQARRSGVGLWGSALYRVRTPLEAERTPAGFQVVEGRVVSAMRRGDRWYLNFGTEWRSDFTVTIHESALPYFVEAGVNLFQLQGQIVRVRGVTYRRNGPMIDVTHPEQIERVEGNS